MPLLYDVSHNTCKLECHTIDGRVRELHVHRKGATRALWPGHADLPAALRPFGRPVLIGVSMGTGSYVLAGTAASKDLGFASACHGAGRAMNRPDDRIAPLARDNARMHAMFLPPPPGGMNGGIDPESRRTIPLQSTR